MSRPCELINGAKSDNIPRLQGLKIKHFQQFMDQEHKIPIIKLSIVHYKNQASRKIKKEIYFSSTHCKNYRECKCHRNSPYDLLLLLNKRRQELVNLLQKEWTEGVIPHSKTNGEIINKLAWKQENSLFVYRNGKSPNTAKLRNIVKEMVRVNKISTKERYTSYSLRIGGTTSASIAKVHHVLILKYVGWSQSRLADCAMRYMRFNPHQLAQVPYKIIHGISNDSYKKKDLHLIYDPWSEGRDRKYIK